MNGKENGKIQMETHCHTMNSSLRCGKVEAGEIIRDYAKAGYKQLVVTDHYYERLWNRDEFAGLSWEESVDIHLRGYKAAREAGEKEGVNVLYATEIQFEGYEPYDFLIYGMDEEYLKRHPRLHKQSPEQFYETCRKEGFLMIHAHPYRKAEHPYLPVCYDGVEVFNGHPRHNSHNQTAFHFALDHNLIAWSGTDYHQKQDCGRGGLMVPPEIDSIPKLLQYVKEVRQPELIITYEEVAISTP